MAEQAANAANQVIDTSQPKPLKGLKLRGVKSVPTVKTVIKGGGPDGEDLFMTVNEADFDKEIHGEKVTKIPKRSKKKVSKKKAGNKKKAGKKKAGKKKKANGDKKAADK